MQAYSHVTVGASIMNRSLRFYDAVLAPLGLVRKRTAKIALAYAPEDFSGLNEPFWVVRPLDGAAAGRGAGAARGPAEVRGLIRGTLHKEARSGNYRTTKRLA